ncbi:GD24459 [Drosophila simulans]|uniref:GD24459 n=1 Tax=Drosophila simulans TaxID=7240 RepID=B4NUQ9_DROSI|nr:GD24459 [Drosophila simulans]
MRSTGQPVLPPRLAEAELSSMQPYHRSKHLALRLDADELLQEARDEMQSQFRHILLVYLDFRQTEKFQRIRKLRQTQRNLPIARFRKDLREALDTSRVVIVAGDTGCGKSTQVPQYLYDFGYRSIACTQPRRLACVSLCKRVAHELLDDYGSRVAFQIRFERSRTKLTNIIFITEGLLLRQLAVAANLDQYDALILDEIHERNLFGDFLLGVTKCLLRARPQLKLILMSATINVELFHGYFGEEGARLVQVPGRLFPIKLRYLPPPALELKAGQATSKRSQRNRIDPAPFVQVLSLIDQQYPSESLLETAKPYLINCIRLPAAQTLLLFSFAIDTNAGITQIACDGWLGLDLPMPGSGMELLSRAIELRRRWSRLLYGKLDGKCAPDWLESLKLLGGF